MAQGGLPGPPDPLGPGSNKPKNQYFLQGPTERPSLGPRAWGALDTGSTAAGSRAHPASQLDFLGRIWDNSFLVNYWELSPQDRPPASRRQAGGPI
jgi:hypothetical protein